MLKLRPYQIEPVRKAIEYFRKENPEPALIVMPTAAGKSVLAAEAAAACPDPILVVQPTKELLEQNLEKYRILCGELAPAGIYSASFGKKQIDHVTFATIGSIKSIGAQFKALGFRKMLIDEAHLYPRKEQSMLGQFLKDSGITHVLGITATPLKLEQFSEKQENHFDKWSVLTMLTEKSPDGTFFKDIIHVLQVKDLTSQGYWSPLVYEVLPYAQDMLELNSTGSEFTEDSEIKAYIQNNIRQNIFAALDYHAERRHCLVFVPSVEEASVLASAYPGSAYICGETSKKERTEIIAAFREEKIRVLFNMAVLTTGFDYPKIDMVILAKTTASVSRYFQMVGRGCRIDRQKKDCVIVDMGGNLNRFGRAEDAFYKKGKDGKWRLYGTDGIILTGFPVPVLGMLSREDIVNANLYPAQEEPLTFGKHKGKTPSQLPMSYRIWLLQKMREKISDGNLRTLIRSFENYVRDTTQDPPMAVIPDGKYAGTPINQIPRGYIHWYYRSKQWNETNDSLKRGLENFINIKDPTTNQTTETYYG